MNITSLPQALAAVVSDGFWEQNRFTLTLYIMGILLLVAAVLYGIVRAGPVMERLLLAPPIARALKVGRVLLVLAGIAMVGLTIFPNQELGMAAILLIFIWPLIGAQLAIGFVSWEKYWLKTGTTAVLLFGIYAFLSLGLLLFVLQFSGYRGA